MTAAIFLDRDGVINENRADHVKIIREYRVLPGALDAIVRLSRHYLIFVVTNQPGIDVDAIESIHTYLRDWVIIARGADHRLLLLQPRRECRLCLSQTKPGMLLQSALDYGLELSQSIMIGDQPSDILAGQAAGAATVMVRSGLGGYWFRRGLECMPDMMVDDLASAADKILALRDQIAELV